MHLGTLQVVVSTPLDGESKCRHHQKNRNAMFWPYCFLDMCGSENSCGNQVAWGDLCGHPSHLLPKPWFSSTIGVGVGFYRLKWKLSLSCFEIQCVTSMEIHTLENSVTHTISPTNILVVQNHVHMWRIKSRLLHE